MKTDEKLPILSASKAPPQQQQQQQQQDRASLRPTSHRNHHHHHHHHRHSPNHATTTTTTTIDTDIDAIDTSSKAAASRLTYDAIFSTSQAHNNNSSKNCGGGGGGGVSGGFDTSYHGDDGNADDITSTRKTTTTTTKNGLAPGVTMLEDSTKGPAEKENGNSDGGGDGGGDGGDGTPGDTNAGVTGTGTGKGPGPKFSVRTLSAEKKWTLALLSFANLAASCCFSLLAPFYPKEAAVKGMSESVTGLVFSVYALVIFLASPIIGNFMTYIGPRFAFIAGQFLAGGCSILFGTLNRAPSGATFIALSFTLRCVTALGHAAFSTASFTTIANEFPDHISVVFAILEVFTGVGYSLGPVMGGFLYDLGGFGLPFYSAGTFLIVWSGITIWFLPSRPGVARPQRQGSVVTLLASPLVVVAAITMTTATYAFGFLDASLSLHVDQFHVSASVTGVFFMLVAALYSLSSPFYGWLTDKKKLAYPLLICGTVTDTISLLLIGPSPLLPFLSSSIPLLVFSLILLGAGNGAVIIPVVSCFYKGARRLGLKDGLQLDGMISGLITSSINLGTFLGPMVGSSVMEATSYEWASTVNAFIHLFSVILLVAYKIVEKFCLKYDDNYTQLEGTSDANGGLPSSSPSQSSPPEDQESVHTSSYQMASSPSRANSAFEEY